MASLKGVAETTTKIIVSATIPGAAAVIAARESYKNCSDEEKGTTKCVMKAVGAAVVAQTVYLGLDTL